jgi:hypothetical protein
VLQARLRATLELADLSAAERQGVDKLLNDVSAADPVGWDVRRPTAANLMSALIYLGNHLEYNPSCRLLLSFSGHGVIDQGRLALAAADARQGAPQPTRTELVARAEALAVDLEARAGRPDLYGFVDDPAHTFSAGAALLRAMAKRADKVGVLPELLDVLAAPLEQMGRRFRAEVILALLEFVSGNLGRLIPSLTAAPRPPAAEWTGVLGPVHLMLALGRHDRRVTLILDACHAGGLGEGLQGSLSGHGWQALGLGSRIFSATEGAELAAEARIGDRRRSAATWALTQVLSRWERVEDGPAYALGIRNGELVLRANLLLQALSFRQRLSLHAPPPKGSEPLASDMAFFALSPKTRTTVDPSASSGSIQLGSDTIGLTTWQVKQGSVLRAVLLAVGTEAPPWTYTLQVGQSQVTRTYAPNTLYVFSNATHVSALAGSAFTLLMFGWDGSGAPPSSFTSAVNAFNNAPLCFMPATGDPAERAYEGPANPSGVCRFLRPGGNREVFLRWLAPESGSNGKLQFISKAGFPFTPGDFASSEMSFEQSATPGFSGSCVERVVSL